MEVTFLNILQKCQLDPVEINKLRNRKSRFALKFPGQGGDIQKEQLRQLVHCEFGGQMLQNIGGNLLYFGTVLGRGAVPDRLTVIAKHHGRHLLLEKFHGGRAFDQQTIFIGNAPHGILNGPQKIIRIPVIDIIHITGRSVPSLD